MIHIIIAKKAIFQQHWEYYRPSADADTYRRAESTYTPEQLCGFHLLP